MTITLDKNQPPAGDDPAGQNENGGATLRIARAPASRPAVITGGAGFIGTNLAHRLLAAGEKVLIYDNLSRPGVERNVAWLKAAYGDRVRLEQADIRDYERLKAAVRHASCVYHFAAQVAVTTSLRDPFEDFEVNARGTLNVLEALRAVPRPPPLIFTSTNKVYGELGDVRLRARNGRYEPLSPSVRRYGFDENRPLHFHSPYGCSKGAACQYVQDYARTFGLPTAVFRMSCIYGPHQFGNEDQGWVAHFIIKALHGERITIFGDGRQVRDVLFIEDLLDAFAVAREQIQTISGRVFNLGGGPDRTLSLLELIELIACLEGRRPRVEFDEWRQADQLYYVSDTRSFTAATGWRARTEVRSGVRQLFRWLHESQDAAGNVVRAAPRGELAKPVPGLPRRLNLSGRGAASNGGPGGRARKRIPVKWAAA